MSRSTWGCVLRLRKQPATCVEQQRVAMLGYLAWSGCMMMRDLVHQQMNTADSYHWIHLVQSGSSYSYLPGAATAVQC